MKPIPRNEIIKRQEDMSPDGELNLIVQDDGDVIVTVMQSMSNINKFQIASIEFCSIGSGGGCSPHTVAALRELARAMILDNENIPLKGGKG